MRARSAALLSPSGLDMESPSAAHSSTTATPPRAWPELDHWYASCTALRGLIVEHGMPATGSHLFVDAFSKTEEAFYALRRRCLLAGGTWGED